MDIIVQGNNEILQLLLSVKSKRNVSYCQSRFLLRREIDDGVLYHNCLTGELVFLPKTEDFYFRQNRFSDCSDFATLISHRFIVPKSTDEFKTVLQL